MGRTSSVKRLDPQARKFLEKLMREDRHTLDELLADVVIPEAGGSEGVFLVQRALVECGAVHQGGAGCGGQGGLLAAGGVKRLRLSGGCGQGQHDRQ